MKRNFFKITVALAVVFTTLSCDKDFNSVGVLILSVMTILILRNMRLKTCWLIQKLPERFSLITYQLMH